MPGLHDGADGNPGSATLCDGDGLPERYESAGSLADRLDAEVGAEQALAGDSQWGNPDRHRDSCVDRRHGGLLVARLGHHRRATPLWRGAAFAPVEEKHADGAPCPGDDRDADSPDARHDALRRPRCLGHRRVAAGTEAHYDPAPLR